MNSFFQNKALQRGTKDKDTLLELLGGLAAVKNKAELRFFLARLPKFSDELWRDEEIRKRVNQLETPWEIAVRTLKLLVTDQPADIKQREFLTRLIRRCDPALVQSRFLPNLLVALNRRGTIEAAGVLSKLLTWRATNSCLITVILVLLVCAPKAVSDSQLQRCAVLRPARIRWLVKFLLAMQHEGSDEIMAIFRSLSKYRDRTHRQAITDFCWISFNTNKDLVQTYVTEAVKISDVRDCDLLVPLLAQDQNTESHRLLKLIAETGSPKASDLARLALKS